MSSNRRDRERDSFHRRRAARQARIEAKARADTPRLYAFSVASKIDLAAAVEEAKSRGGEYLCAVAHSGQTILCTVDICNDPTCQRDHAESAPSLLRTMRKCWADGTIALLSSRRWNEATGIVFTAEQWRSNVRPDKPG